MSETKPKDRADQQAAPEDEARKGGFAQSPIHKLAIRMFTPGKRQFFGYAFLYALCRIVRALINAP